MQTHTLRKVEIIVEAPILRQVEDCLADAGIHVFTVLEGREGRGLAGRWNDAHLADGMDQVMIVAVAPAATVAVAAAEIARLFQRYPGVMFFSDVEVIRPERF
ncbi:MAG: hypothetical protein NW200_12245 [Hyphomonadaceae bacterium]|nr:hypothetical protein [Hyphomonadaceae bacterium]